MSDITKLSLEQLQSRLDYIREAPKDSGPLTLLVRRPKVNERESLQEGRLVVAQGLEGDNYVARNRNGRKAEDIYLQMQLNIMPSRAIEVISPDEERRPLAGDQLYLDLDLSNENLPHGSQLELGEALIEITEQPHTGCRKFTERFGSGATKFVNSKEGRALNLRGVNAKVVRGGVIKVGDVARKV